MRSVYSLSALVLVLSLSVLLAGVFEVSLAGFLDAVFLAVDLAGVFAGALVELLAVLLVVDLAGAFAAVFAVAFAAGLAVVLVVVFLVAGLAAVALEPASAVDLAAAFTVTSAFAAIGGGPTFLFL